LRIRRFICIPYTYYAFTICRVGWITLKKKKKHLKQDELWANAHLWYPRSSAFGHKLHIGTPYRGKRFWTHQIPTSCLPTSLIFIHIEHTFCICPFFVTFFSATIDGSNLIFGHKLHIGTPYRGKRFWTHQIPISCLPTVDFYTHWAYILYMPIFSHIFLSNYWWQKSDIWSQASYRYVCKFFFRYCWEKQ
jgi:hypothetical protein